MDAVQFEPGLSQPLLQVGHSRRVVEIKVCLGCEHFDRFEPVRADFKQVLPTQPVIVIKMRRNAEGAVSSHWSNYPL